MPPTTPAHPTRFRPDLEVGDHLHPNEAGLQAIADAVNLELFSQPGPGTNPPPNGVISLRSHANGKLVTAAKAGGAPLIANSTTIGPWEQFDQIGLDNGRVALRAHANNRFVTAPNNGTAPLIANSTAIGAAETFDLITNADGSVSLRATVNARYACAEKAGGAALIANRAANKSWERFDLIRRD